MERVDHTASYCERLVTSYAAFENVWSICGPRCRYSVFMEMRSAEMCSALNDRPRLTYVLSDDIPRTVSKNSIQEQYPLDAGLRRSRTCEFQLDAKRWSSCVPIRWDITRLPKGNAQKYEKGHVMIIFKSIQVLDRLLRCIQPTTTVGCRCSRLPCSARPKGQPSWEHGQ